MRQRFLAHAGRDHLEPREKVALKRLVEEELLRMQVGAGRGLVHLHVCHMHAHVEDAGSVGRGLSLRGGALCRLHVCTMHVQTCNLHKAPPPKRGTGFTNSIPLQEEDASAKEKLVLAKKVKRPPSPCSDQENKRCRFNSDSDSG